VILKPYSYNGTSLQSTNYEASFPRSQSDLQMRTNPGYVKRSGAPPVYAGKDYSPTVINLEILNKNETDGFMEQFESLNTLFDTKDETPHQFICTDTEDSDKQYYVYATAKQVQGGHDGDMAVVTLALDDPIWQSVTQNSQALSIASTDSTSSTSVTNNGNDYAYPVIEITPTSIPSTDTDYGYNTYVQVLPRAQYITFPSVTNYLPYPNRYLDLCGDTDTTFDTAALVSAGKMQADGDDLRVFQDGVEIDRWLSGINSTDTHVIIAVDMPAAIDMTLGTAIGATDTVTEVELALTTSNRGAITKMPNSGRLILDTSIGSTDTEEFTYTSKAISDTKLAFTVDSRAARKTTAVAHAVGGNVRLLPFDFNLVYGNTSVSAPVTDDTRKPILDLINSRNWSYVWASTDGFFELGETRPGIFSKLPRSVSNQQLSESDVYTSTGDVGDTDPATALGIDGETFQSGGTWLNDTVNMGWDILIPDGVNSVAASGRQSQSDASWPGVYLRAMGITGSYYTIKTIAAQASTDYGTFTAWTHASTDYILTDQARFGLRIVMVGSITGSTSEYAKVEMDALTLGITNYPHVMLRGSPSTDEAANHNLDFTITNDTTGESIEVVYPLQLDQTLTIDTDPSFPYASYNGQIVNGAVSLSSIRSAWLKMNPGANTLSYVTNLSAGSNINIAVKWRDRANFF